MKIFQANKGVSFGNSLFGKQDMDVRDRIAQKKYLYQKQAMNIVSTADKGEKKIDRNVEGHRDRIRYLMEENEKLDAMYQDYQKKMAQAKEDYEIGDDSQEQKDLELLQKDFDDRKHGTMNPLTEEEKARVKEIKSNMTDYQKLSMEMYETADGYKTELERNNLEMKGESALIRSISIERLKEHAMVDAEAAKEEVLAAASKEVMGLIVDDAKEKIEEKAEEVEEKAKEREEKEKEEKERVEAAKENKSEAEATAEAIRENVEELTDQVTKSEKIITDVDQAVKKVMQEQKLLEEELKGLVVNAKG